MLQSLPIVFLERLFEKQPKLNEQRNLVAALTRTFIPTAQ